MCFFKKQIILFLLISISLGAKAQTFTGVEADKKINGAALIRYNHLSELPQYVEYLENHKPDSAVFFRLLSKTLALPVSTGFLYLNSENDKSGIHHHRFVQTEHGSPVSGTMLLIHVKDGKVKSFNGNILKTQLTNISPVLDESTALSKAMNHQNAQLYRWQSAWQEQQIKQITGNPAATWYPKGQLYWIQPGAKFGTENLRLAWRFDIYCEKPIKRNYVYVDALTGSILAEQNRIMDANTPATAVTGYSGVRSIMTDSYAGAYRLRETGRGLGVETYNLQTTTNYGGAVDFVNSTTFWNQVNADLDQYATDAHWGAEMTWDYYDSLYSRNSVDNAGQKLLSYVHFDLNYVNANWDGTEMNYGDGDLSLGYTPLTSIDITGHEISHGVTEHTANLVYQDEPGALNEGFSDCMGISVRQFARNPATINWLIGDEIGGTPFRNMANPSQYGDPDTYAGNNWINPGGPDNGGVHTNSGVLNFWFYLLTMGGTGTNDNGDSYNVSGLGLVKAGQILYRAQAIYNTPNTEFADMRFNTIQAAIDLYGACTNEVIQTTNAWYAVGVGGVFIPGVTAAFNTPTVNFCQPGDTVQFNNVSVNAGNFYWSFGDGNTSTLSNPFHIYQNFGVYTVSLVSDGGACGIDTLTQVAYINISAANPCTAIIGTNTVQKSCNGTVYDSGGPSSNYGDNTNYTITISPLGAASVTLNFTSFNLENNYDYLTIYDGPNISSPQIGTFTGNIIPPSITSTSGSLTLQQTSDIALNYSGFTVNWVCSLPTSSPLVNFNSNVTSTCNGTVNFTDQSTGGVSSWNWDFGDGNTSILQNPTHTYQTSGTFTVKLVAGNSFGNDSLVQTNLIQVNLPAAPAVSAVTVNCDNDTMLSASANGTVYWYDAATAGTLLDTGLTYQTPVLTGSQTYYAESHVPAPNVIMLPSNNTMGAGSNYTNNTYRGLIFNCLAPVTLVSVKVYATGAGNRTFELRNSAGTILQSITLNIPNGTSNAVLNFPLTPGINYELGMQGPANLYRNSSGASYPYTYPGLVEITGNTANAATYYYFFYEWTLQPEPCISPRIPVAVTVLQPQAQFSSNIAGLNVSLTNNSLNATSYEWDFGDGTQSSLSNPGHNYSADGTYVIRLIALSGTCSDTLYQSVTLITTSDNQQTALKFNVYPNPANDYLTLEGPSFLQQDNFRLLLYAADGRLVKEQILNLSKSNSKTIDISQLSNGIYQLKIFSNTDIYCQKISIRK